MNKVRLTLSQAIVRYLANQFVDIDGEQVPLFAGVFAIFGHGNVAGMGEALYQAQDKLPTLRAHNEQSMAHAAIAFAKQNNRQRMMACTTSIGPGAANMVTAAALAHVNRLPVLLLPGDTFANRTPDPVLQQIEDFSDPTVSTNDCFKPVSRYFDRITRPEQIITSLPVAIQTLTDAENCGPVTLSLCQDVQAEAFDYPESFFAPKVHRLRRQLPDQIDLDNAVKALQEAEKPLVIAGGGVHYSKSCDQLIQLAEKLNVPVVETQAGKGSLTWDHPNYAGSIGVTGSEIANKLAQQADLVLAVGTRLQDFTTASRTLFQNPNCQLIQLNVAKFDAHKHNAMPLIGDAKLTLEALEKLVEPNAKSADWLAISRQGIEQWNQYYSQVTAAELSEPTETGLPSDAQVIGAVQRNGEASDVVVCAAGGLPGELHKLWRVSQQKGYHLEYGYSCMGYEIAAGLGVKMAQPEREVFVLVGDGSYMMANSELATSVMLGHKVILVVLDNRGFGCINRLQNATGSESFNNLLKDCKTIEDGAPKLDFAAHAKAMGALSEQVANISELESALKRARNAEQSYVIAIDTDPFTTSEGGFWWDVAIPEVSESDSVNQRHQAYLTEKQKQPY